MCVCLICVISPYSNGAAQIRVGLELAARPVSDLNLEGRKLFENNKVWFGNHVCVMVPS